MAAEPKIHVYENNKISILASSLTSSEIKLSNNFESFLLVSKYRNVCLYSLYLLLKM